MENEGESSSFFLKQKQFIRIVVGIFLIILPGLGFYLGILYHKDNLNGAPTTQRGELLECQHALSKKTAQLQDDISVQCENVSFVDPESDSLVTNTSLQELPVCFEYGSGYEPQLDISDTERFVGYGFDVAYPSDDVTIIETSEVGEPLNDHDFYNFEEFATYQVKLNGFEGDTASIRAYPLRTYPQDTVDYAARYIHSGPVVYERYSNTWWKKDVLGSDGSAITQQCNPNKAATTNTNGFPIYTYGDGDVGHGYTRHVVVMRETPEKSYKGGWTEPMIVEFHIQHVGEGYEDDFYKNLDKLNSIVESMVQTVELNPTSKG